MNTRQETITPEKAKDYLAKQTGLQRSLSPRRVEAYAADMRANNWPLTHQGIAFDEQGFLIDGQHRLHAIVAAGVPVRMQVSYDVDPATYMKLDAGKPRSMADVLGTAGFTKNRALIAATVRSMIDALAVSGTNSAPARERINRVALRHQVLIEDLVAILRGKRPWDVSPVVAALARAALVHGNKQSIFELAHYMAAGLWKSARCPIKKLFDRIQRNSGAAKTRLPRNVIYALAVAAIRAWLDSRELGMIYASTVDFPVPKGALD